MASSRLSKLVLILAALALSAGAQSPTRVRGTISAFDGNTLTVDGKAEVLVGERTEIVFTQPIALTDIKPGDFLGVTSSKRPDGSLTAYEVRRFPKPLNPGHRPFDGRQKIVVPENASISTLVPGQRAPLVPSAAVSLTMNEKREALRIQVGPKTF